MCCVTQKKPVLLQDLYQFLVSIRNQFIVNMKIKETFRYVHTILRRLHRILLLIC